MDYYYKEFEKLQKEFHDVMHDYPIFREDIDEEEKKIKEINELLDKNDDFYFKKAIDKLKDLINYIKETSTNIQKQYDSFDKLVSVWNKIEITKASEKELKEINDQVKKANILIKSHNLKDLIEANKILETLIKDNK